MKKITIITPCYNAAEFVRETLQSMKAQTSNDWECIIVNDGSTDDSAAIIEEEIKNDDRFRVVSTTENRGVSSARNTAIKLASTEYILPLDADDKLMPSAISKFVEYTEMYPDASLIVPQVLMVKDDGSEILSPRTWKGYESLKSSCSPNNTSLFKKSDWERVGGYREKTMYEDWEFWIRLLYKNDNVINIPEVLVIYRKHEGSRWHEAVKHHQRELHLIYKMNPQIFRRKGHGYK